MTKRAREAEAAFREAAGIFENNGLKTDPLYISALAGIGEALVMEGDYPNALASYERAKDEVLAQDGKGRSYALLLDNCAAVADRMNDTVSAAEYREEASRVRNSS